MNFLYDFATGPDDRPNKLTVNRDLGNPWNMRTVVLARLRQGLVHFAQDMGATGRCLGQCLQEYFVGQTINLDIHLTSGDAFGCTGQFKVHIAQMIFITQNIRQYLEAIPVGD